MFILHSLPNPTTKKTNLDGDLGYFFLIAWTVSAWPATPTFVGCWMQFVYVKRALKIKCPRLDSKLIHSVLCW